MNPSSNEDHEEYEERDEQKKLVVAKKKKRDSNNDGDGAKSSDKVERVDNTGDGAGQTHLGMEEGEEEDDENVVLARDLFRVAGGDKATILSEEDRMNILKFWNAFRKESETQNVSLLELQTFFRDAFEGVAKISSFLGLGLGRLRDRLREEINDDVQLRNTIAANKSKKVKVVAKSDGDAISGLAAGVIDSERDFQEMGGYTSILVNSDAREVTQRGSFSLHHSGEDVQLFELSRHKSMFDAMSLEDGLAGNLLLENVEGHQRALTRAIKEAFESPESGPSCLDRGASLCCAVVEMQDKHARELRKWLESKSLHVRFINEYVTARGFAPHSIITALCDILHISVQTYSGPSVAERAKDTLFGNANSSNRTLHILVIEHNEHNDIDWKPFVRLCKDRATEESLDKEMRSTIKLRLTMREFYREGMPEIVQWDKCFEAMATVGISHLMDEYSKHYKDGPPTIPSAEGGEAQKKNANPCYYECQSDGDGKWVRFNFSKTTVHSASVLRFTGRKPALLFRGYLTRIGGDDAVSDTVGDICEAVELFRVERRASQNRGAATISEWITLSQFDRLPRAKLALFLKDELAKLRQNFLNDFVGQYSAKHALISKVVAQSMYALEYKRPLKISSFNQIFVGPPGVGKTTMAQFTGELLYFCGILRVGHVVQKTGAEIGQGTGNADQASLMIKRLYQRATDGVLFIDELYGMTPRVDRGEGGTANQLSAIAAITDLSLSARCCTIAAGYVEEVEECFFKRNEGLRRRFKAIPFEPYGDWHLFEILMKRIKEEKLELTPNAESVLVYLFAGLTVKDRNASVCNDIVQAFFGQLALRNLATVGEFEKRVCDRDVIVCWHDVFRISLEISLEAWLGEINSDMEKINSISDPPSKELMQHYAAMKEARNAIPETDAMEQGLLLFMRDFCVRGKWFSVKATEFALAYQHWAGPNALPMPKIEALTSQQGILHEKDSAGNLIFLSIKLLSNQ
jgi:hypothetical protein